MHTNSPLALFRQGHRALLGKLARLSTRYNLSGLAGSSQSLLVASLYEQRPLVCILDTVDEAGYLYSDLTALLGQQGVMFFPSSYRRAIKYGHIDEANALLRSMLISTLSAAREGLTPFPLIVTYPEAIAEAVVEQQDNSSNLILQVRQSIRPNDLIDTLLSWGFERTDYVYAPGQFALRGSIFDVYAYSSPQPFRIDFFGNEIDSLRTFSPEDQLSLQHLDHITLIPDIAQGLDSGVSLLSLLPESYVVCSSRQGYLEERIRLIWQDSPLINDGEGFSSLEEVQRYLVSVDNLERHQSTLAHLYLSGGTNREPDKLNITQLIFAPKAYSHLCAKLNAWKMEGKHAFICAQTDVQYERVCEIIRQHDEFAPLPERLNYTLHEGFVDETSGLVVLTEHQIFGRYHKYQLQNEQARSGRLSLSLKDLQTFSVGDLVVHADHGIGKFGGLMTMDLGGRKQEVVHIYYRNNDSIYVNLHSLHKLAHYRSKDAAEEVQLSALGSGAWHKLKEKTKKQIKDIARDLIALYAKRREAPGFAFSADSYLQHELEASFKYEYTLDQAKAIEDVKADMERSYPMDRLLCGDVGFGKTEVAMQAAFKAVSDAKQVAVLVPTTVLAYQHYRTFTHRLRDMPVRIEYLSRARSTKEIKDILKDLEQGKIDIVIGTHRLTSKDVKFKDLGLLIIDEEQRFGVAVKERLRKLQVNVDTLTMSATPIPRTLQFSLMGARDLSNISTPPPNRRPVETILTRQTGETIAEAINFEMSRNGQVYVIHNRISDLVGIVKLINKYVPDARVAVGHGQLAPAELEQILIDFGNYEYDVLVATTIVENGIDVPNANTIIITDAQRYGLAALHQLRGRVGRSDRKAFCYLFTPPLGALSDEAQRRLKAIESFSDLGSGVRIALQDLDIRGAGNALGAEQSGFITNMGYETYQKVFSEALDELKREEYAQLYDSEATGAQYQSVETVVETDLEIALPQSYVPGDAERIYLYRELDNLSDEAGIRAYRQRLTDRFGALPRQAEELIKVPLLRSLGKRLGISKMVLRADVMSIHFCPDAPAEYFQSATFGGILGYAIAHDQRCEVRQHNGKHSLRIKHVGSITEAMAVCHEMLRDESNA